MKQITHNIFKKSSRSWMIILSVLAFSFMANKTFAQTVSITAPSASSTTISAGGTVNFTASRSGTFSGSGSNYTFTWNVNPTTGVSFSPTSSSGSISNANTTATFNTPGTYSITCTVQRGSGTPVTSAAKTVVVTAVYPAVPQAPKAPSGTCIPQASTTCPSGSFSASFSGGAYSSGNSGNHNGIGAIWRFPGVTTVNGELINATVKVDSILNATLTTFDDDNATGTHNDQHPDWFAPSIAPTNAGSSGTAHSGFVQFTFTFFKANVGDGYTDSAKLLGINYTHYDIDGTNQLRETGLVQDVPQLISVAANATTDLVSYDYYSGDNHWRGFASSTNTWDGTTDCSQAVASFKYNNVNNPISSVSVRMGYYYSGGNYGSTARLYASKFGCFNFPQEIPLPVKLLSFSGSYQNKTSLLNWEVAEEISFDHYDIERSSNGYDFAKVGAQHALGTTSGKRQYQYSDDLSSTSGNIFYYRLKMVDIDGKSKYSNVIMIRRDQQMINGISIAPNPITNGMATVRLSASGTGTVELRVVDLAGKVVLRQQNQVYEGNNSISLNNLSRLMPGIYTLQLIDGETVMNSKFSLLK